MYLAMHDWMRVEPIEAVLARIKPLGYEAIEISGDPERHDVGEIHGLLKKYEIRCFGGVTIMNGERNLMARDEAQRARSVKYIKDCVTLVGDLGGEEMSVVPGTVGKIVPESPAEDEWQFAVESLQEVYPHAQKCGVQMAIEPINRFETYFINRGDQALALAEAVGPDCKVCLNTFHMNMEEMDLYGTIRRCAPRLKDFHVADNNRMAPGMGALDWPKVIETLREVGYDGALSAGFCAPVDRTPANPFPGAIERNPENIPEDQRKSFEEYGSTVLSEKFHEHLVSTTARTLLPLIR